MCPGERQSELCDHQGSSTPAYSLAVSSSAARTYQWCQGWVASALSPLTLLLLNLMIPTPATAPTAEQSLLPFSIWLQLVTAVIWITRKLNCHNIQKGSDRQHKPSKQRPPAFSVNLCINGEVSRARGSNWNRPCIFYLLIRGRKGTCSWDHQQLVYELVLAFTGSQIRACALTESAKVNLSHIGF